MKPNTYTARRNRRRGLKAHNLDEATSIGEIMPYMGCGTYPPQENDRDIDDDVFETLIGPGRITA